MECYFLVVPKRCSTLLLQKTKDDVGGWLVSVSRWSMFLAMSLQIISFWTSHQRQIATRTGRQGNSDGRSTGEMSIQLR